MAYGIEEKEGKREIKRKERSEGRYKMFCGLEEEEEKKERRLELGNKLMI